ncbi:MAG TPA: hypothetical protein GX506_07800 [Firmicutes bacterium]|nr:hypothetical protein [Bacillota bacterium]
MSAAGRATGAVIDTMSVEGWALLLVVAFLIGYIMGHRLGVIEGYRHGAVFSPIELRRRTLERGRCVICGAPVRGVTQSEAVGDTGCRNAD